MQFSALGEKQKDAFAVTLGLLTVLFLNHISLDVKGMATSILRFRIPATGTFQE